MAHINADLAAKPTEVSEHDVNKWLNACSQVGTFVNKHANRDDLVAKVAPGIGHGAPACFIPHIAEIEVDTVVCLPGADPADIALNDTRWRMGRAPFVGAISHEAAHARWSCWVPATLHKDFPELTKRIMDIHTVLEETRIEAKMAKATPELARFMRASAAEIIAKDFQLSNDPYGASVAAALLLARVDAGVLKSADVERFIEPITELVGGEDVLNKLQVLWKRFQKIHMVANVTDPGTLESIEIAKEWLDVLNIEHDDPEPNLAIVMVIDPSAEGSEDKEKGEGGDEGESEEGDGEGSGGSGSGEDGEEDEGEGFAAGAREMGMDIDTEMAGERRKMDAKAARDESKAEAARQADAKKTAVDIFHEPAHGLGHNVDGHLRKERAPTPREHAAAVKIAKELEKAQYRDRVVTKKNTVLPPGRMRGRGAVQRAAQESRGGMVTAEAWRGRRRTHTDEPPLVVGIMTDISGSMRSAEEPSAVMSWVLSEATRRIHGKVATVLFGEQVHGVVKSGARQDKVRIHAANDGHEAFTTAFKALDGELNILNAPGAKLLCILSDAHFVEKSHAKYADKVMGWCKERGVAVMWISTTGHFNENHGWGEVIVERNPDALDIARRVGVVAVEAIKKANSRMAAV